MTRVSKVPAAEATLAVLSLLARQPGPIPAARIAAELGLPRSTTYHLLSVLIERGFVVHLPEERRYGLGLSAFELGSAYTRQAPLARLCRPLLNRLVDAIGESAHLAVLHGRDVLYVVEERAPRRPSLVTDVDVRLPAQITASGRAILAELPPAQVRALFPSAGALADLDGAGPRTPTELRRLLNQVRRRGYATEEGEVSAGFSSIALAVRDHNARAVAGLAITWQGSVDERAGELAPALRAAAQSLSRRLGGPRG